MSNVVDLDGRRLLNLSGCKSFDDAVYMAKASRARLSRTRLSLSDTPPDFNQLIATDRMNRMNANLDKERAVFKASEDATHAEKVRVFTLMDQMFDALDARLVAEGKLADANTIKRQAVSLFTAIKKMEGLQ